MTYCNMNIEPGDATRYQVMMEKLADGVFIALGTSEIIRGGCVIPFHDLANAPHLLVSVSKTLSFGDKGHSVSYVNDKAGFKDDYMAFVAIVLAWLFSNHEDDVEVRASIIGYAYHGKHKRLQRALEFEATGLPAKVVNQLKELGIIFQEVWDAQS